MGSTGMGNTGMTNMSNFGTPKLGEVLEI